MVKKFKLPANFRVPLREVVHVPRTVRATHTVEVHGLTFRISKSDVLCSTYRGLWNPWSIKVEQLNDKVLS